MRINSKVASWLQRGMLEPRPAKNEPKERTAPSPSGPVAADKTELSQLARKEVQELQWPSFDGDEEGGDIEARAESFTRELALRIQNARGDDVRQIMRDLKLREAALRHAMESNESIVSQGLVEFLH